MVKDLGPAGVLMVGSVPLSSVKAVFTKLCCSLSGRLQAIPDGEVGERWFWIVWQCRQLPADAVRPIPFGGREYSEAGIPTYTLESLQPTEYDDAALASYADFVSLRKEGIIPQGVRFQVSLPSAFGVVQGLCKPEIHTQLLPLYTQRLKQSISRIIDSIPHEDLVIQFDLAFEVCCLERATGSFDNPWFDTTSLFPNHSVAELQNGMIGQLVQLTSEIPEDVPLAIHLCYGDVNHKHIVEPHDTGLMVSLANDVLETLSKTHQVAWLHMPVPKSRVDAAYFEPLNNLHMDDSTMKLYLGLVHADDLVGTQKRIEVATQVCPYAFGVATECGLGRTPKEQLESILSIAKEVSRPVTGGGNDGAFMK